MLPLQGFDEDRSLLSLIRSQKLFFFKAKRVLGENYKVWSYIGEVLRLDKETSVTALPTLLQYFQVVGGGRTKKARKVELK